MTILHCLSIKKNMNNSLKKYQFFFLYRQNKPSPYSRRIQRPKRAAAANNGNSK